MGRECIWTSQFKVFSKRFDIKYVKIFENIPSMKSKYKPRKSEYRVGFV